MQKSLLKLPSIDYFDISTGVPDLVGGLAIPSEREHVVSHSKALGNFHLIFKRPVVYLVVVALGWEDNLGPLGVLWGCALSGPLSLDLLPVINVVTEKTITLGFYTDKIFFTLTLRLVQGMVIDPC